MIAGGLRVPIYAVGVVGKEYQQSYDRRLLLTNV